MATPSYCGNCGASIPPTAAVCPRCKAPVDIDLKKTMMGVPLQPLKGALLSQMAPPPLPAGGRPLTVLSEESSPPAAPVVPAPVAPAAPAPARSAPPPAPARSAPTPAPVPSASPRAPAPSAPVMPAPPERRQSSRPPAEPKPTAARASPVRATRPGTGPAASGPSPAEAGVPDMSLEKTAFGVPSIRSLRESGTLSAEELADRATAGPRPPAPATTLDLQPPAGMSAADGGAASPAAVVGPGEATEVSPPPVMAEATPAEVRAPRDPTTGFPGRYIHALKYFMSSSSGSSQRRRDRRALEEERGRTDAARQGDVAALGEAMFVAGLRRPDLLPFNERLREADARKEDLERRRAEVDTERAAKDADLEAQDKEAHSAMLAANQAATVVRGELSALRAQEKAAQKEAHDAHKRMDAEGKRILEAERKVVTNPPNAQQLHAEIVQAKQNADTAEKALTAAQAAVAAVAGPIADKAAALAALEADSAARARTLAETVAIRKTYGTEVTARLAEFQKLIQTVEQQRREAAGEAGEALVKVRLDAPALGSAYDALGNRDAELARIDEQLHGLADADAAVDQGLLSLGKKTLLILAATPVGLILMIVLLVAIFSD